MRKKRFDNGIAKNLRMDDDTYKLRRIVIGFIYEALKVVALHRIDVRITEETDQYAGLATLNGNVLWINKGMLAYNNNYIRALVYHEIIHACFGIGHIDGCILMDKLGFNVCNAPSKDVCEELLKKYSTNNMACMC